MAEAMTGRPTRSRGRLRRAAHALFGQDVYHKEVRTRDVETGDYRGTITVPRITDMVVRRGLSVSHDVLDHDSGRLRSLAGSRFAVLDWLVTGRGALLKDWALRSYPHFS